MATETLQPNNVFTATNLTDATVARLDESPDSPAGDWATWDGSGDVVLVAEFPTPTNTPGTGAGLQKFRIYMRKNSGSGSNQVDIEIHAWENGTGNRELAYTATNYTSTGAIIEATWDATNLVTASGANVGCNIVQTNGGTGGPSARAGIDIDCVEWVAYYDAGGGGINPGVAGFNNLARGNQ